MCVTLAAAVGRAVSTRGGTGRPSDGSWPEFWTRTASGFGAGREDWAAGWARDERPPADPKGRSAPNVTGWREIGLVEGDPTWRRDHGKRMRAVRLLRRAGYVARHRWERRAVGLRQVGRHVVSDVRYQAGPAEGRQAVDPWKLARELATCGASWWVQPRQRSAPTAAGSIVCLPLPRLCGRSQVCPVCASLKGRKVGRALAACVDADNDCNGDPRRIGHLTLTQRAHPGESLHDAIERWRDGWRRMTRGRPGRRFAQIVHGYYYGMEVTRGDGASAQKMGPHWHVHAHAVLALDPSFGESERAELGRLWEAATAGAAAHLAPSADGRGWGWDPLAGAQEYVIEVLPGAKQRRLDLLQRARKERWEGRPTGPVVDGNQATRWQEPIAATQARLAAGDWSGPWLRMIDPTDPADLARAVAQAADYACKTSELHPVALAEFVSAAHGRRWHQGGGIWRGIHKQAAAIEDAAVLAGDDDAERVDLGVGVGGAAPGESPALDLVLPGAGWIRADVGAAAELVGQLDPAAGAKLAEAGAPSPPRAPAAGDALWVEFRLADRPESDELIRLLALADVGAAVEIRPVKIMRPWRPPGGELRQVEDIERQRWLTLPAEFVRARALATTGELRQARLAREAAARLPSRPSSG